MSDQVTATKLADLERRIKNLELMVAKLTAPNHNLRLVQDERGRGVPVTVGGNNGGY